MERTWNKGMAAVCTCGVIEEESSRETGGGGKEGNVLTGSNIEAQSDAKLKKMFKSSFKTSNAGFLAWCVLGVCALFFLVLWRATGIRWFAFIGAGSLCLASVGIVLAFAAQTVNQIVRAVAKWKGKCRGFFSEEEKECSLSKAAAECCGFVKRVFSRDRNEAKRHCNRYEVKYTHNQHARNNARSYRSASRPAFTHSSGDDGDDSGESDSGDPPGPLHHTALKLSPTLYSQSNNSSCPWRSSRASGCWRMSCRRRSPWRWAT
jgi:hypothetical protein